MRAVTDTESDGLLMDATKFHCICTHNIDTKQTHKFYGVATVPGDHGSIECGTDYLRRHDMLIGHNLIGHDLPLLNKLTDDPYMGKVLDTLIWSRALDPDRPMPPGCPTHMVTKSGNKDRIGPHSLAAWGWRLGFHKVEHEDWSEFSPEMLHRCQTDVAINVLVLDALCKETGCTLDTIPPWVWVEQRVAQLLRKQEERGWLVDQEKLAKNTGILEHLIDVLEEQIIPDLPMIAVREESKKKQEDTTALPEYKCVERWATKGGKWSAQTQRVFPEFEQAKPYDPHVQHTSLYNGQPVKFSVGGPFSRVSFRQISLSSMDEIKDFLLKQGWQPTEWNIIKKGPRKGEVSSPKLTEDSYDSLDTVTGKLGRKIAQHIKANHRLRDFRRWWDNIAPDGRIHAYVNGQGCPTVRMQHKVLVNVPSPEKKSFFAKKMREVFIAAPGYVLVGTDAVSCQARLLCHYMGDDEFTYSVVHGKKSDGTDLHSLNMNKTGLPTRGHAKNFFYGFIFGAGPAKVGRLVQRGKDVGKQIIDRYLANLPKLMALRDGLKSKWDQYGYITGIDGRKIYPRTQKDLLCYLLQGGEAILMKWAMCYVNYWIAQEGLDAHQVMIMHDEYTFEVRIGQEERVKYLTKLAIQKAGEDLGLTVPADGDPASGPNWYKIH